MHVDPGAQLYTQLRHAISMPGMHMNMTVACLPVLASIYIHPEVHCTINSVTVPDKWVQCRSLEDLRIVMGGGG